MWNWLLWAVPWQIQVTGLAVLAFILIGMAMMTFGVAPVARVLRTIGLPILGLLAALGLLSRARQQGYQARKDQEDQAAHHAEVVVDNTRRDVQGLPDDQLNDKVDKWSRG